MKKQQSKNHRVSYKYKTGPFKNQKCSKGFDSEPEMIEFIKVIVGSPDKKITNFKEEERVLPTFETLKLLYKAGVINAATKEG